MSVTLRLKLSLVIGPLLVALVAAFALLQPLHQRLAIDVAIQFFDEIFKPRAPELRQPSAGRSDPRNVDSDGTTRSLLAVAFMRADGSSISVQLRSRCRVGMLRVAFSQADCEYCAVLYASPSGDSSTSG